MEFKSFDSISRINKVEMTITQKIHGFNAQILIVEVSEDVLAVHGPSEGDLEVDGKVYRLTCGSRNRWIYPGDDNYGFATFVHANKKEFIEKLGVGRHFGEWAGPGINSGEGLTEKTLVLFDWWKFPVERPLPPQTKVVPVLYSGPFDLAKIEEVANDLKTNGSKLSQGFMRPEGVVIQVLGTRLKKVFDPEETAWTKPSKVKAPKVEGPDVAYLLQPIRLEKLLSRDEAYVRDYPSSLSRIVKDYVADLEKENQIPGDEDQVKATKKALGGEVFKFVKAIVAEMPV